MSKVFITPFSCYSDEFSTKIKNFITIEEVDFGQVKKYLSLFPDRVYRNIYQAGLMNELV